MCYLMLSHLTWNFMDQLFTVSSSLSLSINPYFPWIKQPLIKITRPVSPMAINPWGACPMYIQDMNVVITVPADGLAPNGARPSAGTMLTTKLDMY